MKKKEEEEDEQEKEEKKGERRWKSEPFFSLKMRGRVKCQGLGEFESSLCGV